ncbi:MAG: hypothetical protein JNL88_04005 [Bacteroidia bacterium]|nr:hypothetical protein [Bacteroidia bacterium]
MLAIVTALFFSTLASAQDDLLGLLGEETPKKEFVKNAFKATRVITGQSMEQVAAGVLDFRILHRFGRVNGGPSEAFGLDQATIRLGLDYGISDRIMIGIGRSSNKKELDGFIKYRMIWQGKGKGSIPFSVILISGVTKDGLKWANPDRNNYYTSRLAYYHQVLIGRKFSESFSMQVMPTAVHRNLVPAKTDEHDIYAVGAGARIKLTRRIALNAEYFYLLPDQLSSTNTHPLSIGFDIETGGHVFQLHFTNALGMNERSLITDTNGSWEKGDIHFGFNISRVFTLSKPKTFRKE